MKSWNKTTTNLELTHTEYISPIFNWHWHLIGVFKIKCVYIFIAGVLYVVETERSNPKSLKEANGNDSVNEMRLCYRLICMSKVWFWQPFFPSSSSFLESDSMNTDIILHSLMNVSKNVFLFVCLFVVGVDIVIWLKLLLKETRNAMALTLNLSRYTQWNLSNWALPNSHEFLINKLSICTHTHGNGKAK